MSLLGESKLTYWAYAVEIATQHLDRAAEGKGLITGMLCLVGVDTIPACRIPEDPGKGRTTTKVFCERTVPAVEPKAAAKAEYQTQSDW